MMVAKPNCRHCRAQLTLSLADLGATPVANDFLDEKALSGAEPFYPLHVYVCSTCRLAQLQDFLKADALFRADYAYFSSFSDAWLAHARDYAAKMQAMLGLGTESYVVEVASNDGYLLQNFQSVGVPILGVEPSQSVAEAAIAKGIPTQVVFFGVDTAKSIRCKFGQADLIVANNVFAHVPDVNDFAGGFRELLKPDGVVTVENPHLLNLIEQNQFDTIYHEHYSYLSLLAVERVFEKAGLRVFDVEQLSTHGGSLRYFGCLASSKRENGAGLEAVRAMEKAAGLDRDDVYVSYAEKVRETKRALLSLLIKLKREGAKIAAYGAPAKGNTLLNYCGVGRDFIDFTVDRSPSKQGRYLPGTHIPIKRPEAIKDAKPDYVLILPWNLADEITSQMAFIRDWGGQFIVPIPEARILG
jgi:SAM-dependent methyltransferase